MIMGAIDDRFRDLEGHLLHVAHVIVHPHFDDIDLLLRQLGYILVDLRGVLKRIGNARQSAVPAFGGEALASGVDARHGWASGGTLLIPNVKDEVLISSHTQDCSYAIGSEGVHIFFYVLARVEFLVLSE